MLGQNIAQKLFVLAEAIKWRGIEQGHAMLQGVQQNLCTSFRRGRSSIRMTQVHATKSDSWDLKWADISQRHFQSELSIPGFNAPIA